MHSTSCDRFINSPQDRLMLQKDDDKEMHLNIKEEGGSDAKGG